MIYIDQLSQSVDGNQFRQEFGSKTQQLPGTQWKPSLQEGSFISSNSDQSQTQDNQQQNQGFGTQQGFSKCLW